MSQRKLPVELISKIVSQVKEQPSLARTMGKYLSKKEKQQLTNFSNKMGVLKNCNTNEVKNLKLLGIKFTFNDMRFAAKNNCLDTVKFLQKIDNKFKFNILDLPGTVNFNEFKTLLDSKRSDLRKSDLLNLIGILLLMVITRTPALISSKISNFLHKDKIEYLIKIYHNYFKNIRDIFKSTPILQAMNNIRNNNTKFAFYSGFIIILNKCNYKLNNNDIQWFFNDVIKQFLPLDNLKQDMLKFMMKEINKNNLYERYSEKN